MNDDELKDLFSAFDEVSTPDSMKASALDFIMAASAAGGAAVATGAAAASSAEAAPVAAAEPAAAYSETSQFVATRTKKRTKSKWQAVRVAAVAACLALALTGGAAYALSPVSIVTITQGDTTIEVSANLLGMVSVNSNNDTGREIVGSVDISGLSLDDSVAIIRDSMAERDSATTITVVKRSNGALEMIQTDGKPATPSGDNKVDSHLPVAGQPSQRADGEGNGDENGPVAQPGVPSYDSTVGSDGESRDSSDTSSTTPDQPSSGESNPPIDDPVDDPTDDPIEDPIDDPVDEPIDDPIDEPIDDPTDEPWVEPEPEEPPLDDQGDGDGGWEPPEIYDQSFDNDSLYEPEQLA